MIESVRPEFMVFVGEGQEGVAAVREVRPHALVVYVENAGEFVVPEAAIRRVHDGKVVVDPSALDQKLRDAIGHRHGSEDPRLAG